MYLSNPSIGLVQITSTDAIVCIHGIAKSCTVRLTDLVSATKHLFSESGTVRFFMLDNIFCTCFGSFFDCMIQYCWDDIAWKFYKLEQYIHEKVSNEGWRSYTKRCKYVSRIEILRYK